MRAAVVGAGAWGTALADLLARNGHEVRLWAYEPDVADSINSRHENSRFLGGQKLASSLVADNDLSGALAAAELVAIATPSQVLRKIVRDARPSLNGAVPVVIASKGIERGSLSLMTDVASEELPDSTVVALSGPSFAAEVASCQPTAVVAASTDTDAAELTQRALSSAYFRVYTHTDVIGVELGRSEEHTSELQSRLHLVCRLLLEKKKK